jgi:hypothetical protein
LLREIAREVRELLLVMRSPAIVVATLDDSSLPIVVVERGELDVEMS